REGGAYGTADDAEMSAGVVEFIEIGVITCPPERGTAQSGLGERADDIAVRVEQTNLGYCRARQVFLPPRLPQQIFRLEDRRRSKVFPGQDRRWIRHFRITPSEHGLGGQGRGHVSRPTICGQAPTRAIKLC